MTYPPLLHLLLQHFFQLFREFLSQSTRLIRFQLEVISRLFPPVIS